MNSVIQAKDKIQKEALKAWQDSKVGSVILPTGSGKTRLGVLVAEWVNSPTLIVVPTANLKNNEWKNEFEKWGVDDSQVHIECIQTVHKWDDEQLNTYKLVILDEIHTTLSEIYGRIHTYKPEYKLGLTATPPGDEDYLKKLEEVCPIVYSMKISESVELGLISPYEIYNLPVTLTRKERFMYNKFDTNFNQARSKLNKYIKAYGYEGNAFDLAKEGSSNPQHPVHKEAKAFWSGMSMRKWVVYKAENKLQKCVDIIEKYPDKKWIVFSKNTDFADALYKMLVDQGVQCVVYHSKMSKEDRIQALEDAKSKDCRAILSAEALNAGYDLPDIDAGICAAGVSTALPMIQQLGRTVRLKEDKKALFINLYAPSTQEEVWVKNKTADLNPIWIKDIKKLP